MQKRHELLYLSFSLSLIHYFKMLFNFKIFKGSKKVLILKTIENGTYMIVILMILIMCFYFKIYKLGVRPLMRYLLRPKV